MGIWFKIYCTRVTTEWEKTRPVVGKVSAGQEFPVCVFYSIVYKTKNEMKYLVFENQGTPYMNEQKKKKLY